MKFYTTSKISENMHETPEGYLVCVGVSIARTGEMDYGPGETPLEAGVDGKVVVSRDAKEVFRPETMASFEGKAVTILHPKEFVSPDNHSELAKGSLQNVRRGKGEQENDLVADLLITDSVAINLIKNGLREVSCGYEAEYTQMGIGRGTQSRIIGNHLALVEEGRAGSTYSINDHKGKGLSMSWKEKIKAHFAKAQDEAMKIMDEASPEKKDDDKKEPAKDDMMGGYDALMKACKDLGEKVDALNKPKEQKDASTEPTESEAAKVVAKDAEAEEMEKKKVARDAWIDAQMEKESKDADPDTEEVEEIEDEDDLDIGSLTGDTASRIEILAPGSKLKGKDAKSKALLAAYATTDGKSAIDKFTGGKSPNVKDESLVDAIFIGASEILKGTRRTELAKTKTQDESVLSFEVPKGGMSAEKINELNEKHYAKHTR